MGNGRAGCSVLVGTWDHVIKPGNNRQVPYYHSHSCRRELKLREGQLFAHSWDLHIGLAPVSKQEGRPRDVEVQT